MKHHTSSHQDRTFDDQKRTSNDPEAYKHWCKKLRSLCLPLDVIDQARGYSPDNVIDLLLFVKRWLQERRTNSGDEFNLPVHNWKSRLEKSFPHISRRGAQTARDSFPNHEYEQWRHLVLCAFEAVHPSLLISTVKNIPEAIEKMKADEGSGDMKGESVDDDMSFVKTHPPSSFSLPETTSTSKRCWDIENKPANFIETECFERLCKLQRNYSAIHIYGGKLRGKTYALRGLTDRIVTKSTPLPSVILHHQCREGATVLARLEELVRELLATGLLTQEECEELASDSRRYVGNLVKLLREKELFSIFIFDDVTPDDRDVVRAMIDHMTDHNQSSTPIVQVIASTCSRDQLGLYSDATSSLDLYQLEMNGFTEEEAVSYLTSDRFVEVVCYRYLVDSRPPEPDYLSNQEDARALVGHFNNNPGCLRLAKVYCITRKLSYRQYLDSVAHEQSGRAVLQCELEIAKSIDKDSAKSLQAMRALLLDDTAFNEHALQLKKILKVLACINNEDIPIHLVGKVCQELRANSNDLSPAKNFELNKIEACEAAYRLQEMQLLRFEPAINYPNGLISIRGDVFTGFPRTADSTEPMEIALKALVKMVSKDNTERRADIRLHYITPHMNALSTHIDEYLLNNFDAKDKKEKNFVFSMLVSRLYEIFGQGIIQERRSDPSLKFGSGALQLLTQSASLVWDVARSFSQSGFLFAKCFRKPARSHDLLAYEEGFDPAKKAATVAKECVAAGERVDGRYVESYLLDSLVLNKTNLAHFVTRAATKLNASKCEAEARLKAIRELVEKHLACQARHLDVLRDTGNLLTTKQLRMTFFGERLSSIYHTYGRQVLYLQSKMSKLDQSKCEYYTQLAHNIAKEVRRSTGVYLLTEYITIANAVVPRLFHNTGSRLNDEERIDKLEQARQRCRELLEVDGDYYENGCYRLVRGTAYTKLNVYKYLVKANTKLLKHVDVNQLPAGAWRDCDEMVELARCNSSLDMVPHIFIQAAKFYAASGRFEKAFPAFSDGFDLKKNDVATGEGILHLRDWRPGTVAWAVNNYCLAVDAFMGQSDDVEEGRRKRGVAVKYCKQVLGLGVDEIGREWHLKIESWLKHFQQT